MPFSIEQEGDKYCVYNNGTKAKEGEFDNRMAAMKKMRQLYATEAKAEVEPAKKEKSEKKSEDNVEGE